MDKMSNPRDEIKDLPDTPCHPVGSHFPSRTFGGAKKLTEVFSRLGAIISVGYITITHKILCFASVAVRLLRKERCD